MMDPTDRPFGFSYLTLEIPAERRGELFTIVGVSGEPVVMQATTKWVDVPYLGDPPTDVHIEWLE